MQDTATEEIFEDDANVVISARGTLNEPKWPKINGMEQFQGVLMHSAIWDET